jgi:putative nucleotidyltransferase with HDIG domain
MATVFAPLASLMYADRIEIGSTMAGNLLEHSLKCAQLAQKAGAGDIAVLAALFHDIGHAFASDADEFSDMPDMDVEHAMLGARYLERYFPAELCMLVADHIEAKRYLAARGDALASLGSRRSLSVQGGAMSATEQQRFEQLPHFLQVVQLRRWDNNCDTQVKVYAGLASYAPMIERTRIA